MNDQKLILVWDIPTRVFHWLLVICFSGAWLTSESERLQMIHYAFGYSAAGLVLFRLIWGVIGTRYARFSQFVKGPKAIIKHFKHLPDEQEPHSVGHNPAGALVMLGLMGLILIIVLTGYLTMKDLFGDFLGEVHEAVASFTLAIVGLHIVAALVMSVLQKENLVRSMLTGKKLGLPDQAIRFPQYLIGILLFCAWAYCFYAIVSGLVPSLTQ